MKAATRDKLSSDRLLLRRMVQSSAAIVALVVALILPLGYAFVAYEYEARDALLKAQLSANQVARYIFQYPRLWEYSTDRLSEMIGSHDGDMMSNVRQRIVKPDGTVVAAHGTAFGRFTMVNPRPRQTMAIGLN